MLKLLALKIDKVIFIKVVCFLTVILMAIQGVVYAQTIGVASDLDDYEKTTTVTLTQVQVDIGKIQTSTENIEKILDKLTK